MLQAEKPTQKTGGFHYAWVVVAITFFTLLAAAGIRGAPSVFLKPWENEYHWARSSISFAVGVSLFIYGLGAPLGSALVERFGLRRVMFAGLLLNVVGLAPLLALSEMWQLHLLWGLVLGVSTGMLGSVLGATVANRWFTKNRGVVIGLLGAATAAGQLVVLPPMVALTKELGWRSGLVLVLTISLLMALPVLLFMRENPRDVNRDPVGGIEVVTAGSTLPTLRTPLRAALRTRDFWLLAASFFVCGYTTNGLIGTHLLPHAVEHGFSEIETSGAIGLMGAMNIVGTMISGWLSDRFDNRKLLAGYYGFRAMSLLALPFVIDMRGLLIFAIVYGLDWIATVPPTVNLVAQRFGRASVGQLYGWIFCSHMFGAGVAAFAGGFFHDILGDYHGVFISAAVLGFAAVSLSLSVSDVRRKTVAVSPAQ